MINLRRLHRRRGGDDGMAMMFVVGGMAVVTTIALTGLAYTVQTTHFSRHDQDWSAALSAAQAGLDDYISHLNRNDNYWQSWDCSNLAEQGPQTTGNACGWNSSTQPGFVKVNPGGGANSAQFHYDIDTSKLADTSVISVTSTGKVNGVTRTVDAAIAHGSSTDYVYYTDHEDADPDNTVVYPNGMPSNCANYWWNGRSSNDNGCQEIEFAPGDLLDGAVRSNDTPLFGGSGVQFTSGLQVADPNCQKSVATQSSTWKYCDRTQIGANYGTHPPMWAATTKLTDNSDQFINYPGCKYTGSTRIVFNNNGTMTVWSAQSTASTTTSACGGGTAGLTNGTGATVSVPTNQTVYVANATSGQHQCYSGEIGDSLPPGSYTKTNVSNRTSYSYDWAMTQPDMYCGQGNAFIQGTLKGRVTVATQNSIVVTGDLLLAGGMNGPDMLGLVAGNSVEVIHPIMVNYSYSKSSGWSCPHGMYYWWGPYDCAHWPASGGPSEPGTWPKTATSNQLQIQGSIQTLQHSFLVQNYDLGSSQGKLTVFGSIAQEWRGIVGTSGGSGTGYLKDYHYDRRLRYSSPPYFPSWVNSQWMVKHYGQDAGS